MVARRTSSPTDPQPVQALLLLDVEFLLGDVIWPHRFPWLHAKLFVEGTHAPFLDVHAWAAWHPLHLDAITCRSQENSRAQTHTFTQRPRKPDPSLLAYCKRAGYLMEFGSVRISEWYPMGCQNIPFCNSKYSQPKLCRISYIKRSGTRALAPLQLH